MHTEIASDLLECTITVVPFEREGTPFFRKNLHASYRGESNYVGMCGPERITVRDVTWASKMLAYSLHSAFTPNPNDYRAEKGGHLSQKRFAKANAEHDSEVRRTRDRLTVAFTQLLKKVDWEKAGSDTGESISGTF